MQSFKDFGIQPEGKKLVGEKIKISKVLNVDIVVYDYSIKPSKIKQGEDCLYLQIGLADTKRVVFTGSKSMLTQIQKVPATGFPFTTKIIEDNEQYEFT